LLLPEKGFFSPGKGPRKQKRVIITPTIVTFGSFYIPQGREFFSQAVVLSRVIEDAILEKLVIVEIDFVGVIRVVQ
jgi:hypothetical protein